MRPPPPIRPPALKAGDRVQAVAPAGPFDRGRFERGLAALEAWGLTVELREDLFDTERYFAGSLERRLGELQDAFGDPGVAAIWAARGGYGAMRLLPHLDLKRLLARPKLLVRFSDVTALHAPLNRAGLVTLHGPVLVRMGEEPRPALDHLHRLLFEAGVPAPLEGTCVAPGRAEGRLVGGNLSVFTRLLGTPYLPALDGAILLLEDVAERPYRLDRMLCHLELAGVPGRIAGVVLGELTGCEEPDASYSAADVVHGHLAAWGVPVLAGLHIGHGEVNFAVPLGAPVTLDADAGRLSWNAPVLAEAAPKPQAGE